MAKERKSPQEKKELEYKRDRHEFAWHSDKGLPLARPRRKAGINRKYRHKADTAVRQVVKNDDLGNTSDISNELIANGIFRRRLSKVPPPTLKEAIAEKLQRRQQRESRKPTKVEKCYREGTSAIEALERMDALESLKFLDLLKSYSQHIFKKPSERDPMWSTATWVLYLNQGEQSSRTFLDENPDWASRYAKIMGRLHKLERKQLRGGAEKNARS